VSGSGIVCCRLSDEARSVQGNRARGPITEAGGLFAAAIGAGRNDEPAVLRSSQGARSLEGDAGDLKGLETCCRQKRFASVRSDTAVVKRFEFLTAASRGAGKTGQ